MFLSIVHRPHLTVNVWYYKSIVSEPDHPGRERRQGEGEAGAEEAAHPDGRAAAAGLHLQELPEELQGTLTAANTCIYVIDNIGLHIQELPEELQGTLTEYMYRMRGIDKVRSLNTCIGCAV